MKPTPRRQNTSYLSIKERLREDILAHVPGSSTEGLLSQHQLREKYGVSRPTISKALSELAAEGLIVRGSDRSTYIPATSIPVTHPGAAASERAVLGFVTASSTEQVSQSIFQGIRRAAGRSDYSVLMAMGDNIVQEEDVAMELVAAGVRGLIINPAPRQRGPEEKEYLGIKDLGVPYVLVDTSIPDQGSVQILFDNRAAGYNLTRWLLEHGHTRIASILEFEDRRHAGLESRARGYRDALQEVGIGIDPALVKRWDVDLSLRSLPALVDELLTQPNPPTAIMTMYELLAIALIEELMRRGIQVPEEIEVTGFDQTMTSAHFHPPFATTNPNFDRMGELASQKLIEIIDSKQDAPKASYILPVPVVIPSSTGSVLPARLDDAMVSYLSSAV